MSQYQGEKRRKRVGHIQEPWKEITFLWKIENFTKLPQEEDSSITSPVFSSAGYSWYLELYPNGEKEHLSHGWFGLYTQQCGGRDINSTFEASIQNSFGRIEFEKKEDDLQFTGITKFLLRRDLFDRRDACLPGDTLTIWIRHKHEVPCNRALSKTALRRERRLETLRAYNKYKEELSRPGANTTSVWGKMAASVRNKYSLSKTDYGSEKFHSQMLSLKREYELHRKKTSITSPYVDMFLKEAHLAFEDDSEFPESYKDLNSQIQASKTPSKKEKAPAKHHTGLLASEQAATSQRTTEEKDELPTVERSPLKSVDHSDEGTQNASFERGDLTLLSDDFGKLHVDEECSDVTIDVKDLTLLSDNFEKLLFDEECSDVTIDVKGKTIKAHKVVLKVRSEGLFSKLKNNSAEDKNLVIKIEDCDPEAFEIFVQYLYTGKVEKLSVTKLDDLYHIALKFNAPHLRAECEKHMIRSDP